MPLTVAEARGLFPGLRRVTHFNAAGLGMVSSTAAQAVEDCLRLMQAGSPDVAHHGDLMSLTRARAARFVGAEPHQIGLVPATTLALNMAASAIPLERGTNVVTCDLEFMSPIVPFFEKCHASGAELRVVPHREGRIDAEAVIARLDDRTRAVVLSAVQWTNGYRVLIDPIGEACERLGIPFVVDGIQQLGALRMDVRSSRISFLACGGHKWLTCPSATGFIYVSDDFASRFRPTFTYAPTARPPAATWQEAWLDPHYDAIRTYPQNEDASRFEVGVHHGVLGASALDGALSVLEDVGGEAIEAHVVELAGRVAEIVADLGFEVVTVLEPEHRSGITTFRAGPTAEDDRALVAYLNERDVVVSARFTAGIGGTRVSTHFYNSLDDVETLAGHLEAWRRGSA